MSRVRERRCVAGFGEEKNEFVFRESLTGKDPYLSVIPFSDFSAGLSFDAREKVFVENGDVV